MSCRVQGGDRTRHKLHNLLVAEAERELQPGSSPRALSLDTRACGPDDSVVGRPVIVQCLVCIRICGTCFQILTIKFRRAFLLRSLDCCICRGFLFFIKKMGGWGSVEYSTYQTSRCETANRRADLVAVGAGAQSSLTHSLQVLLPLCSGDIPWD